MQKGKKSMAILIKTNGDIREVKPLNGKKFTYEELREFVGGMVEIVSVPSGRTIYLNEEGKLIDLPKNEAGTALWKLEYPIEQYPNNNDELMVGDILLLSAQEEIEQNQEDE